MLIYSAINPIFDLRDCITAFGVAAQRGLDVELIESCTDNGGRGTRFYELFKKIEGVQHKQRVCKKYGVCSRIEGVLQKKRMYSINRGCAASFKGFTLSILLARFLLWNWGGWFYLLTVPTVIIL